MVNHPDEPATTVWELWNAPESDPGMNSRNHIMFGSVSSWFFKHLVGIQPVDPGYLQASIRPSGQSTLEHVSATVGTPYGDIVSSWKWKKANASYSHILSIPPGTNATFLLPFEVFGDKDDIMITEGQKTLWSRDGFVGSDPGVVSGSLVDKGVQFILLNGKYEFEAIRYTREEKRDQALAQS